MVPLPTIRAHNATLSKTLPHNLVAVFVGGTSGIGLFTARQLVLSSKSPKIYLIGRNHAAATSIISELTSLNPSSTVSFIQQDVSLLRNVDAACSEIAAKEKEVNLLFMTCGYLTLAGRKPTPGENLDKKLALHYYTRMRFVDRLAPLLTRAAQAPPTPSTTSTSPSPILSRVVSVLDPQAGLSSTPSFTDLSLSRPSSYTLKSCFTHASAMHNLSFTHLAQQMPGTGFIHAYPSGVDTGALRELPRWMTALIKPLVWMAKPFLLVPQEESGERHLFAATAGRYAGKDMKTEEGAAVGNDDVPGEGSYLLNWNGDVFPDTKVAKKMREDGGAEKVWRHTEEVFQRICFEGREWSEA